MSRNNYIYIIFFFFFTQNVSVRMVIHRGQNGNKKGKGKKWTPAYTTKRQLRLKKKNQNKKRTAASKQLD